MPVTDHIDEKLIKACRANQRQAQRRLYELTLPTLTFLAKRYLTTQSEVPDALQEAYLSIFQHLGQFDATRAGFSTWAGRIVINACLKKNRSATKAPTAALGDQYHDRPDLNRSSLDRLTDQELLDWLKCMPRDYYVTFNLVAVEGYDHSAAANLLSITPALSRKRLARARDWLKQEIANQPDHPLRERLRWKPDTLIAPITLAIQMALSL